MTVAPGVDETALSTRERALRVASTLFLERGYEGTSLVEIARELGISTPSLYWHFKSKQDLLYQFLTHQWEDFLSSVEAAVVPGDPPSTQLWGMAHSHVMHGLRNLAHARAFTHQYSKAQLHRTLPSKQRRVLAQYPNRYLDLCRSILVAGIEDGSFDAVDPTMNATVIINMCESVLAWFDPKMSLSIEEVADFYAGSVLRLVSPMRGAQLDRSGALDASGTAIPAE